MAFPHVSHRFTSVLAFWDAFGRLCLVLFVLGCVLFFVLVEWLPALPRRRSFLPDLMTVRAVMVCAALEKKNIGPRFFTSASHCYPKQ